MDETQTTPIENNQQDNAQALRDLEAGFEDEQNDEGREPTATPAPDAIETPPAEPAPEYAQITKAEYDKLIASAAEIDQIKATQEKSLGTAFGKIGGIERRLTEMQAAPSAPVFDFADAEIDELKDDWPQLAAALSKLKNARPAQVDTQQVVKSLEPTLTEIRQQARIEARNELRSELLAQTHEDWREVTGSAEFAEYSKSRGADYLSKLATASQEWDHRTIGSAISEFKDSRKRTQANATARRSRLDAAVTPRGTPAAQQGNRSAEDELMAGFRGSP